MKKVVWAALALFLVVSAAWAYSPTVTIAGWVGDSMCATKSGPDHASCAKSCIKNGAKAVIVDDQTGKVIPVENQDAITSHAGEHVQATGTMTSSGAMHIDSVKAAAGTKSGS